MAASVPDALATTSIVLNAVIPILLVIVIAVVLAVQRRKHSAKQDVPVQPSFDSGPPQDRKPVTEPMPVLQDVDADSPSLSPAVAPVTVYSGRSAAATMHLPQSRFAGALPRPSQLPTPQRLVGGWLVPSAPGVVCYRCLRFKYV